MAHIILKSVTLFKNEPKTSKILKMLFKLYNQVYEFRINLYLKKTHKLYKVMYTKMLRYK